MRLFEVSDRACKVIDSELCMLLFEVINHARSHYENVEGEKNYTGLLFVCCTKAEDVELIIELSQHFSNEMLCVKEIDNGSTSYAFCDLMIRTKGWKPEGYWIGNTYTSVSLRKHKTNKLLDTLL